jgi:hypothetical protein
MTAVAGCSSVEQNQQLRAHALNHLKDSSSGGSN